MVGGQTYTPSATATSGDTVTIGLDATSTGCSINGSGVVSFTGVGTCVIDFNDAGNANYAAATPVQQSFSVGQGTSAITVTSTAPGHAVVGGQTYTPSATATSGDTVTIGLDATSTGCSINGSGVVSFTGVGTCVIDFNDAGNANYAAATPVQQSFKVNPAPLVLGGGASAGQPNSITVTSTAPGHAVVGGQTYTPSATATSGDTVTIGLDATSTGCSINGSGVVSFTGVGTCVIDFNDAGNANYAAATPVQQSFSVGQGTNEVAQVGRWATVLPSGADSTAVMSASRIGGSAKGCVVRGDHVTAAGAGTCVVLEIVRESSGSGTTSMVITVDFHARARVEGVRPDVVRQTTQTIVIVGQGLFGTPRVTSRGAGIRATIVRATPKELVVRVSRSPSASRGLHILRLVLPDGQVLTVRYVIA